MSKRRRTNPAPSKSSQQGPCQSSFAYEIVSTGRVKKSMIALFSIPEEQDECPLTLELIKESKLSFLDTTFCEERPLHSKLTLPCGHSFHSLSLLYSLCKNSMRCPCCRQGHEGKADPKCLPVHIRGAISERVETEEASDALEMESLFLPYSMLAESGSLIFIIKLFETTTSANPLYTFSCLINATDDRNYIARCDYRSLSEAFSCAGAMQLAVHLHLDIMNSTINIDCSRVFEVKEGVSIQESLGPVNPILENREVEAVMMGRTNSFQISSENKHITNIIWKSNQHFMQIVANAV